MAQGFMRIQLNEASIAKAVAGINLGTKKAGLRALKKTAQHVMVRSKEEVPKDTETLMGTAYIEQPKITGNEISITMGYGGAKDKMNPVTGQMASEYAMIVHENTDWKHPRGKAKYLEEPMIAGKAEFEQVTGAELKIEFPLGGK